MNEVIALNRPVVFGQDGSADVPPNRSADDVANVVYFFARRFDDKNANNDNISPLSGAVCSYTVEQGYVNTPVDFSQATPVMTPSTTLPHPGLFAVTGSLTQKPKPRLQAVAIPTVNQLTYGGVGDLY